MRRVRLGDFPVRIPAAALVGIDAIRESGLTNMLNRPLVAELAASLGHQATTAWIREHPKEYATGIFHGFVPEDESEGV